MIGIPPMSQSILISTLRTPISVFDISALSKLAFLLGATCISVAISSAPTVADPIVKTGETLPKGWAFPGGETTNRKTFTKNAFSKSSSNLPFEKELDFKVGNGFFKRLWVKGPASTQASDGLGPLYNARSCQRCHIKDGRGHVPKANFPDDVAVSMFLRLSIPPQTDAERKALAENRQTVIPEPTYGGQLQDFALSPTLPEGHMHISYQPYPVTLADGTEVTLQRPKYKVTDLNYGPLHADVMISPRIAPPMIGLGLLEAIAEEDILAKADPDDTNGDGISGKPNYVWDIEQNQAVLGRFGLKSGQPNLKQQAASAFAGDIGISNPLVPKAAGDCTPAQTVCMNAPTGNSPQYDNLEAPEKVLQLVTFYTQHLAVPARRKYKDPDVIAGRQIFLNAGCSKCHTESYVTKADYADKSLANQKIWPYTDLLLHDMGPDLADQRPEGQANGQEWRTAPLWGLGMTKTVNGHMQLLHDGRANGVLEAILWHGGEAESAKQYVQALSAEQRALLIAFLEAL